VKATEYGACFTSAHVTEIPATLERHGSRLEGWR
jgi:hypothetical protein